MNQLLEKGHEVKAFARNITKFSTEIITHKKFDVIGTSVLDMSEEELENHTKDVMR